MCFAFSLEIKMPLGLKAKICDYSKECKHSFPLSVERYYRNSIKILILKYEMTILKLITLTNLLTSVDFLPFRNDF